MESKEATEDKFSYKEETEEKVGSQEDQIMTE